MTIIKPETNTMGRVITEALVENVHELWAAKRNLIPVGDVHRVNIPEALVDTDATLLSLPTSMIHELNLERISSKRVTTSKGVSEADVYGPVRLTIQGRSCTMDVMEVPDDVPPLIGQIPLEHLDFVVDLRGQKLIGNPEHGGEHMYEMYFAASAAEQHER